MTKSSYLFGLLLYMFCLSGEPTVVSDPVSCLQRLELHFFNEELISQALSFYDIRQELWSPISKRVMRNSLKVPSLMKQRTAFMVPNPIEFPMQRGVTAQLLKEVLMDIFLEAMTFYGVNKRPTAIYAFDYIFTEQLPLFIRCFGDEVKSLQSEFD